MRLRPLLLPVTCLDARNLPLFFVEGVVDLVDADWLDGADRYIRIVVLSEYLVEKLITQHRILHHGFFISAVVNY